jgi:hypothetical protein
MSMLTASRIAAGLRSFSGPPRPWLGDARRCIAADCLLLALAGSALAVCLADGRSVSRLLLVLGAACLVPGCAVLTRLPVANAFEAVGIGVSLGFCIEAAGALAMVWTGWWHPFVLAITITAAASVMLAADLARNVASSRAKW